MANLVVIGVMFLLLDLFVGIPLDFWLTTQGVETWIFIVLLLAELVLPLMCFMLEMNARRKYPIRVFVTYKQGDKTASGMERTKVVQDRIGYLDVKSAKDEKTGAKEWRLRNINKPVLDFKEEYVYDVEIWMGLKTARFANVNAATTPKGEEFYGMSYDAGLKGFKPAFSEDRRLLFWKIDQDIETRNTFQNWWKQHLMEIIKLGLEALIIIVLFLIFLQLTEISKNNAACAGSFNQAVQTLKETGNVTTSAQQLHAGNVAGIPFGTTGG